MSRLRALALVLPLLAVVGASPVRAQEPIFCSGESPDGIVVAVRLDSPADGSVIRDAPPCDGLALVEGAASATGDFPPFDVLLVIDSSASTAAASGLDVDADGELGTGGAGDNTDRGDSVLAAEVLAARRFIDQLRDVDARVGVVEFSAVLPDPRAGEQGRVRVAGPLSDDLDVARLALDEVEAAGPAGATDYAGALDAALAELERNGDPDRAAVVLFVTDGQPTFPRFPWDSTEVPDLVASLEAAQRAADAGVLVHAFGLGRFGDEGLLAEMAGLTGGTALTELDALAFLDAFPDVSLTGIESVSVVNDSTGLVVEAEVAVDGTFSAEVALVPDVNVLRIVVVPVSAPAFELECSASLHYECSFDEDACFRESTDATIRAALEANEALLHELGSLDTCDALSLEDADGSCAAALREYAAFAVNRADGRLTSQCRVDLSAFGPGLPTTVPATDDLLRVLLASGAPEDCALVAEIAAVVNDGSALVEVPPEPPEPAECVITDPETGLDVTITIESPVAGDELAREPCDGRTVVEGRANVSGLSNLFDLFFVIDSSGSTGAASGRDIDGDGMTGVGGMGSNTDPGDSVLAAEVAAVWQFVDDLDPAWARVSIIEFAAIISGSGGRMRIVQPLTDDFDAVRAALDDIRNLGSSGATDYGGALRLLDQEYLANAEPAMRIPICFFLSDGRPTFPDPPFNSTEPADRQAAIDGAGTAAMHGIEINTYEVGPAGAADILQEMSDITGGTFFPALVAGDIVDVLNDFNLVGIAEVRVRNETTGEETDGSVSADGSFEGEIGLEAGSNEIVVTIVTEGGESVTASCSTEVDLVFENLLCRPLPAEAWSSQCRRVLPVEPTLGSFGSDPAGEDVVISLRHVPLTDGLRVYRGDLAHLHATGEYTHVAPFTGGPVPPECLLTPDVTTFVDAGARTDGRAWYYLVVPILDGVEGSFGWADRDGDGHADRERPAPEDDPADAVENTCP